MNSSIRTPILIAAGGLLLGVVMGALILFGLPFPSSTPAVSTTVAGTPQALGPAPVSGAPAPDFSLQDLAGNTVRLADAKGHPVLINFWATWCIPCRDEMPAIEARYQAHKDKGFLVYAVDFDEPAQDVQDFAKTFNLSFHVLLDPGGKVNDQYRILGYPTSFFVDSDGVIQVVHVGAMTPSAMDDYLTKVLP